MTQSSVCTELLKKANFVVNDPGRISKYEHGWELPGPGLLHAFAQIFDREYAQLALIASQYNYESVAANDESYKAARSLWDACFKSPSLDNIEGLECEQRIAQAVLIENTMLLPGSGLRKWLENTRELKQLWIIEQCTLGVHLRPLAQSLLAFLSQRGRSVFYISTEKSNHKTSSYLELDAYPERGAYYLLRRILDEEAERSKSQQLLESLRFVAVKDDAMSALPASMFIGNPDKHPIAFLELKYCGAPQEYGSSDPKLSRDASLWLRVHSPMYLLPLRHFTDQIDKSLAPSPKKSWWGKSTD